MKLFNYSESEGFSASEVIVKGEKKFYVEGYASTIDEDKAGEILDQYAQEDLVQQLNEETITMDIEHEEWYDDKGNILPRPKNEKIPVAKIIHAEKRPRGTWIKAELNKNLRSFHEVWGSIKEGFLRAFSVAFYPIIKRDNKISKLRVVNVTLTGSPVNPYATFTAVAKSALMYMKSTEEENMVEEPKIKAADTNAVDTPGVEPKKEEPVAKSEDGTEKPESFEKKKDEDDEEEKKKKEEAEAKCNKPKVKSMEEVKAEIEAKMETELKAFRDELDKKDKVIAELKAELEKPVMKATMTETPKPIVSATKKAFLDFI